MYFVYILTNNRHTVYYTGFTNDLYRRVYDHKNKLIKGFTYKYNCSKLLYYEQYLSTEEALHRENS